jgi:hypothetical protein
MDRGYTLLWRKTWKNHVLYERGKVFSRLEAWMYITNVLAQGIEKDGINRGEFEASYRFLARAWNWETTKVFRFIKQLEAEGMLSRNPLSMQHLPQYLAQQVAQHFIVCNYETYNPVRNTDRNTSRNTNRNKSNKDKEGIKEREKEYSPQAGISPSVLFEIYESENKLLPQVKARSQDRLAKCRSRINQAASSGCLEQYLQDFREAVKKAQSIPFLCGEKGWRASFDWFIENQTNAYKVLEGKYDSNGKTTKRDTVGLETRHEELSPEFKENREKALALYGPKED